MTAKARLEPDQTPGEVREQGAPQEQPRDEFGGLFERDGRGATRATDVFVRRVARADNSAQNAAAGEFTDWNGFTYASSTSEGARASNGKSPLAIIESLAPIPALQGVPAMARAEAASPAALQTQRERAQQALPQMPAPTGLAARERIAAAPGTAHPQTAQNASSQQLNEYPEPERGREIDQAIELACEAPAAHQQPTRLAGSESGDDSDGELKRDPALERSAQDTLAEISAPSEQVATTARQIPAADMTGEADPGQLESRYGHGVDNTRKAATTARAASGRDFGENDIAPTPDGRVLEASQTLREPPIPPGRTAQPADFPAEAMASIDAQASPVLHERVGAEQQTHARGQAQYDADSQTAHREARQDITALEQGTAAAQQHARACAQNEVTTARQDWKSGIAQVQSDFHTGATQARDENQRRIAVKELEGNERAAQHIAEAEVKAATEKNKASAEIERKKKKAKKKSKGFWGWARSRAKALINGVKRAVNVVYDNLRKAVKVLFDVAKKLALAAIELARKAIVGLITAHGAILNGLVSVALAALPRLRDQIEKRIGQAVDRAAGMIDRAAHALEAGVTAIIDILAETIDKLLGLVQDLYNAALTVIGMVISGEFRETLGRLGNLIEAAKTAPGLFETAAYEELLGGDLDQPPSPGESASAGHRSPMDVAGEVAAAAWQGDQTSASKDEWPGPPWTESNVGVDAVATGETLSPELSEQFFHMTGGDGEVSFGESRDPSRSLEAILGTQGQTSGHGPTRGGLQAAHDDGMSPRDRAAARWDTMKTGLANWWSSNWSTVLAGGILSVAGFIVATILTGGTILAALPAIMSAIGYLFSGIMLVQLTGHLRDFLDKGWNGDIQGGGKSLAKGLAAAAIELITLLTFKAGSVALKGAKTVARGAVRGTRAVAKGTRAAARGTAALARRGIHYIIKGGKVLLRGAGRGIASGAKRLTDLGTDLLQRTRFRGFRIRIRGRRFAIEGRINPWVTVAEGQLVEAPEGVLGAKWVDHDTWATGRLQRRFRKPRKSIAEMDEAERAKAVRRQNHEDRKATNSGRIEEARVEREQAVETLKHVDQSLENTSRDRSGHGHGHKDHGYQTRLHAHRQRVETGQSPSGRRGKTRRKPESSAKFYGPEAELEALRLADEELQRVLQLHNTPAMRNGQPNRVVVEVTSTSPRGFGGGYKAKLDSNGRPVPSASSGYEAVPAKKLQRARVVYEYVPSSNTWAPVTYHPLVDGV